MLKQENVSAQPYAECRCSLARPRKLSEESFRLDSNWLPSGVDEIAYITAVKSIHTARPVERKLFCEVRLLYKVGSSKNFWVLQMFQDG